MDSTIPGGMQEHWTKPAAMAIPKGGFFKDKVEQGRYGPIFPKTPACYGFSIIAKIIPGREEVFYEYAKNIEKAVAGQPDALAVLKLHYLRWVLFDIKGETYFMYQGIFDTDFDKYTEDAVGTFRQSRPQHGLRKSRRVSDGLEDEPRGVHQVRPRSSVPELPRIRRISVCERRRDQESAQAQGGVLAHARPDAVSPRRRSRTMLEFDDIQHILLTRAPALTAATNFCRFATRRAAGPGCRRSCDKVQSAAAMRASVEQDKRWVTVAFTWNGLRALGRGRGFARHVSGGVQAGHGGAGGDARRHRRERIPTTGSAAWPAPTCTRSSSCLRATLRSASGAVRSTRSSSRAATGVEVLSSLDLEAIPPFDYAHDHFGYRDRLSQPAIEGSGEEPTPGSGEPLKPGEFILGYPDEDGAVADQPAAGNSRAQRQLHGLPPAGGARGQVSRLPAAARRDRRKSRN